MDLDQIKTFLSVAAHGSFQAAAGHLYVTQSTVSIRIQRLEAELGAALFVRNRAGAALTSQGQRFLPHAQSLLLTFEQARHDIGLPSRFRASIAIGARVGLWQAVLPDWIGEIRRTIPDIAIRGEIGFEDDLMRGLIQGRIDIGMMYTPQHSAGLLIEHLFDETLILLASEPDRRWPDPDYVYVDWGPAFYTKHANCFPDLEGPAQRVNIGWLAAQLVSRNGGSCFLPERIAAPLVAAGRLFPLANSPSFTLPAYMVSARAADHDILRQVVDLLRAAALRERHGDGRDRAEPA